MDRILQNFRYEMEQLTIFLGGSAVIICRETARRRIMVLILGFLVCGIFSGEIRMRTDVIFFTSFYGRDKAIHAKMKAGFRTYCWK